jgi:hypothetical protein
MLATLQKKAIGNRDEGPPGRHRYQHPRVDRDLLFHVLRLRSCEMKFYAYYFGGLAFFIGWGLLRAYGVLP